MSLYKKNQRVVMLNTAWNTVKTGVIVGETAHMLKVLVDSGQILRVYKSECAVYKYTYTLEQQLKNHVREVKLAQARLRSYAHSVDTVTGDNPVV